MKIEIIFHSSSTPKQIKKVKAIYTKGGFCCVQVGRKRKADMLQKYPMENVFSVCHKHGFHWGTGQKVKKK